MACSSEYASGKRPIGCGRVTADDEDRPHPGRAQAGDHLGDVVLVDELPGRQVWRDAVAVPHQAFGQAQGRPPSPAPR